MAAETHFHRHVGGLIPFTGGLVMFLYAFFWPDGYGHWLGTIVSAFRRAAGF